MLVIIYLYSQKNYFMKTTVPFVAIIALTLSSSELSAQSITKKVVYGADAPLSTPKVNEGKQSTIPNNVRDPEVRTDVNNGEAYIQVNPSNANYNSGSSIVSDHFEVDYSNKAKGANAPQEHINVNYAYSQSADNNTLDLMLNTSDPVIFSVNVVDANGKVRAKWTAKEQSHIHQPKINISMLPAGNYTLNIFWNKSSTVIKSIPFNRVINTGVTANNNTQGFKK